MIKVFISFLLTTSLFAITKQEVVSIYETNFSDMKKDVKMIGEHYFILNSSTLHHSQNVLLLKSKLLLLKYLKKHTHKDISTVYLKRFTPKLSFKKDGRSYLFSYIKVSNITISQKKKKTNVKPFDIYREIEKFKDSKTLEDLEILKELYLLSGDLENYDKTTDKIMELKFFGE